MKVAVRFGETWRNRTMRHYPSFSLVSMVLVVAASGAFGFGPGADSHGVPVDLAFGCGPDPNGVPADLAFGCGPDPNGVPVDLAFGCGPDPNGAPVDLAFGCGPDPNGLRLSSPENPLA